MGVTAAPAVAARPRRKSPSGETTGDVTVGAHVGANSRVFPRILDLHVPRGSVVADVTHGKGVFWKEVDPDAYRLLATDIETGVDCRDLPYGDGEIDCVVLDPPYMEGMFRENPRNLAGAGAYAPFRETYSDGRPRTGGPKYHAAVLDLYFRAGDEALRVLRPRGVFIVKCQDEVSANVQHPTHVELVNRYASIGFHAKDLFVVVRDNRPAVSRVVRPAPARKNHSYFLIFVKTAGASPRSRR